MAGSDSKFTVVIAIDGSDQAKEAFECKSNHFSRYFFLSFCFSMFAFLGLIKFLLIYCFAIISISNIICNLD